MAFEFEPSNPFNLLAKNSSGFQTMEQPGNGQEHPDPVVTLEQKPFGWTDWARKSAMKNGDYFEHDKKIFNQRDGKTYLMTGDGMGDVELDDGQAGQLAKEREEGGSHEPTSNERLTRAFQYNVRGNKTAEEHSEAIKAPFKPVGEVVDGYFSLPVDDPKEYDSKSGLWEVGRGVGSVTPLWDSGRQYGQLATDIQRRDMRGEAVSDEERMRSTMYRDKLLIDGAMVGAGAVGVGGKLLIKIK